MRGVESIASIIIDRLCKEQCSGRPRFARGIG